VSGLGRIRYKEAPNEGTSVWDNEPATDSKRGWSIKLKGKGGKKIPSSRRGAGVCVWHISGSLSRPQMPVFLCVLSPHGGHATSSEFNFFIRVRVCLSALSPCTKRTDGGALLPRACQGECSVRLMGIWCINLGAYDQTSCGRTVRALPR
jgi:hypothetical protein